MGASDIKFEDYMLKQDRYYQRMLVIHMIKSGESLEWVVERLISGKKIPNSMLDLSDQPTMKKTRTTTSMSPGSKSSTYAKRNRIETSGLGFQSSTPTGRSNVTLRKTLPTKSYANY